MRAVAALLLLMCTACGHMQAGYKTTVSSGSSSSVSVNSGAVYMQGGAPLTFFILSAVLIASAVEPQSQYPNYSILSDWKATPPPPEMKADRVISEQDCTKPIVDWSANLKCR